MIDRLVVWMVDIVLGLFVNGFFFRVWVKGCLWLLVSDKIYWNIKGDLMVGECGV